MLVRASPLHRIWRRWELAVVGKGENIPKRLWRAWGVLPELWEKIRLAAGT